MIFKLNSQGPFKIKILIILVKYSYDISFMPNNTAYLPLRDTPLSSPCDIIQLCVSKSNRKSLQREPCYIFQDPVILIDLCRIKFYKYIP